MPKGICEYYLDCNFAKRYKTELSRKDKITVFHQYIELYCFGSLQSGCYRYCKIKKTGISPPADITPTGIKYSLGL